jgi:hypothetical protein
MSEGIRSGVNWMRFSKMPRIVPSVIDELGLGKARRADEQRMAAGQNRDDRVFDDLFLAEDDLPDFGALIVSGW